MWLSVRLPCVFVRPSKNLEPKCFLYSRKVRSPKCSFKC